MIFLKIVKICLITLLVLFFMASFHASSKIEGLAYGWIAAKEQVDPFDISKMRTIWISKNNFTFRCNELNFSAPSYGYADLSLPADIKYIVDNNKPIDKRGTYSTWLGGSDHLTDSRYYSFKLLSEDIMALKKGNLLKAAGRDTTEWLTRELDLKGFTLAYSSMECEKK